MSDPYTGEIQIFGFNFAPVNWAFCAGQIMTVQQNTALFSLLGTQFGGNGTSTFGLPNFQNNAACGQGQGPGLSPWAVGEQAGEATHTLLSSEMPAHTHPINIYNQRTAANKHATPANNDSLTAPGTFVPFSAQLVSTPFANGVPGIVGGNQSHNNQQPYLAVNFCICLYGDYPQRP
ncbi:microcystin-dependent protein [Luteibacter sp. Sphag1AF]|uniref:phage tail protein n=1 Tax=Luteibacter sp. Sphag1AF TaxID=2587031 RepID=UPI0016130548|nr:tail fiber protein [Luteibacter sp. Sphag1AF]MBB3226602.1 microcystin-dependent protein [Luteibacter sp. Sphag1AF]